MSRPANDDDEEFSYRAYLEAMRRGGPLQPYREDELLTFTDYFAFPRVSGDFEVQVRYWQMRRDGQSHNMAEMLATRTFPGAKGTDRAFMQGRYHQTGGAQFEHCPRPVADEYLRKAEAAGVNPTGKWYSGGLARFPGDPMAWVDSLADVKRVAEARGAEVSGAIEVKPPRYAQRSDPKPYRVADDIVQARLADQAANDPAFEGGQDVQREDLAAELTAKLSGVHGTRTT